MHAALMLAALTLSPGDGCGHGYGYGYGYGSYYNSYGSYYGYSSQYGDWSYSPYYKYGYTYYYASYGYPAGWYYYNPKVYVSKYVPYPVYTPVAFTTYQPAALLTKPLGAIEQASAVQATSYGVAAVPAIPTVTVGTLATLGVNAVQGAAGVAAAPSKCDQALMAINERLTRMEQAMSAPQQPNQLPPPPTGSKKATAVPTSVSALVEKGKAVFVAKCSRCHAKGDEEKPQLFNGKEPLKLDVQTLADCQSSVLSGEMPPASEEKLEREDGQALIAYFVSESRSNKKAAKLLKQQGK